MFFGRCAEVIHDISIPSVQYNTLDTECKPKQGLSPVDAENLRHQAIFVDQAASTVAPPDAEAVQVGDATRSGPGDSLRDRRCRRAGVLAARHAEDHDVLAPRNPAALAQAYLDFFAGG
jgi:hypothetical protein